MEITQIIVAGGAAGLPGFISRLQEEIRICMDAHEGGKNKSLSSLVNVFKPSSVHPLVANWFGVSILSCLQIQK
jgi:actin-related protein